jgi:hypothetical protein
MGFQGRREPARLHWETVGTQSSIALPIISALGQRKALSRIGAARASFIYAGLLAPNRQPLVLPIPARCRPHGYNSTRYVGYD